MPIKRSIKRASVAHTPTAPAPIILTDAAQDVDEGVAFSVTLTANEDVTWSKEGGPDATLFTLTGDLLELPAQDGGNSYSVTVKATSVGTGRTSNRTITVTVADVIETETVVDVNTLPFVAAVDVITRGSSTATGLSGTIATGPLTTSRNPPPILQIKADDNANGGTALYFTNTAPPTDGTVPQKLIVNRGVASGGTTETMYSSGTSSLLDDVNTYNANPSSAAALARKRMLDGVHFPQACGGWVEPTGDVEWVELHKSFMDSYWNEAANWGGGDMSRILEVPKHHDNDPGGSSASGGHDHLRIQKYTRWTLNDGRLIANVAYVTRMMARDGLAPGSNANVWADRDQMPGGLGPYANPGTTTPSGVVDNGWNYDSSHALGLYHVDVIYKRIEKKFLLHRQLAIPYVTPNWYLSTEPTNQTNDGLVCVLQHTGDATNTTATVAGTGSANFKVVSEGGVLKLKRATGTVLTAHRYDLKVTYRTPKPGDPNTIYEQVEYIGVSLLHVPGHALGSSNYKAKMNRQISVRERWRTEYDTSQLTVIMAVEPDIGFNAYVNATSGGGILWSSILSIGGAPNKQGGGLSLSQIQGTVASRMVRFVATNSHGVQILQMDAPFGALDETAAGNKIRWIMFSVDRATPAAQCVVNNGAVSTTATFTAPTEGDAVFRLVPKPSDSNINHNRSYFGGGGPAGDTAAAIGNNPPIKRVAYWIGAGKIDLATVDRTKIFDANFKSLLATDRGAGYGVGQIAGLSPLFWNEGPAANEFLNLAEYTNPRGFQILTDRTIGVDGLPVTEIF